MPTPIAYSVRPYGPNGNTVTVTNACTNVTIANFPVASGPQNILLSGDTLTVAGPATAGSTCGTL
jgi:hypothetical protein